MQPCTACPTGEEEDEWTEFTIRSISMGDEDKLEKEKEKKKKPSANKKRKKKDPNAVGQVESGFREV